MHLHPYFPHYYLTESKIWASYWKPSFSLYEILSSGCVYVSFSLISLSVYSQQVFKHAEITNILKNQQQKKKSLSHFPMSQTCQKNSSTVKQRSLIISNRIYLDLLAAIDRIPSPSLKSFLSCFLSLAAVILAYSTFYLFAPPQSYFCFFPFSCLCKKLIEPLIDGRCLGL